MTTLGRRSTVVGALSGMLLALTVALSGPGAAAEPEPALPQPAPGSPADELSHPFGSPVGANDWSCRPSAARPTPVVLVHGTFADSRTPLDRLSGRVKLAGYCVYSLDYGWRGTQRIRNR